ncbi:MAG TPA: hypothetical protein VKY29_05225 [Cryomorphaceae bacterium]|nr:hypothetical protein [Cryomorphaceae bacterium]
MTRIITLFAATSLLFFLNTETLCAQQLFIPGDTHSATVNNRGIGIGIDAPDAKLHVRDRANHGTALLLDIGAEEYDVIGGGSAWNISDYALKVNFTNPQMLPTPTTTQLSIDKNGRLQAGFSNPAITDQIAAAGSMGVYSGGANLMRLNFDQTGPQLQWKASSNRVFKIVNEETGTVPLRLTKDGKVGINTDDFFNGHDLYVNGSVYVKGDSPEEHSLYVEGSGIAEEMFIKLKADWPDYVFHRDYALLPLSDLENFIDQNGHLPEMPTASEVEEEGVKTGEILRLLTQKVEELTLYILQQQKEIDELKVQLKNEIPTKDESK